jgi:hypothetical protein
MKEQTLKRQSNQHTSWRLKASSQVVGWRLLKWKHSISMMVGSKWGEVKKRYLNLLLK